MSAQKQNGFSAIARSGGFTLIELLVVISIIAILSVIGITAFSKATTATRDTKRRSDIDSIAAALEQKYRSYSGQYPALLDSWFQSGRPKDPSTGQDYAGVGSIGTKYVICADLENDNGNSSGEDGTNAPDNDGGYYCRKSLQGG